MKDAKYVNVMQRDMGWMEVKDGHTKGGEENELSIYQCKRKMRKKGVNGTSIYREGDKKTSESEAER